ncbi:SMI1/KNR4 family protein [Actinomadura sp. LOL_016]|uniref:SMI1/KNR4 family protein n=1 Tax=unclassified Actinomadura TaxID=2626254 RepID=UPI003A812C06
MWRELAERAFPEAGFRPPAPAASLDAAERRLGGPLPAALRDLLRETDGVTGPYGLDVVWSLEQVVEQNAEFRTDASFAELYMPFDPLLFFGDNGGGDQFAFVRTPPADGVVVWDHETDARFPVAPDLRSYLERAMPDGGDWYRD